MPQSDTEWTQPNTIDRRPIVNINSYGNRTLPCPSDGEYPEEVERKSACWWRGADAIDELLTRIQDYYDVGWRRILLNRPNGVVADSIPPSPIWAAMLDYKKQGFQNEVKSLLQSLPDLEFGFYAGFKLTQDPAELFMDDATIRVPNMRRREDIDFFKKNYEPLADLGIKMIVFDNASAPENKDAFLEVSSILWSFGIKSAAEAIPRTDFQTLPNGQQGRLLDNYYIDRGTFLCTEQFLKNPGNIDDFQFWGIDPQNQECHMLMQGFDELGTNEQTTDSENFIDALVQAGFVVGAWGAEGKWFYNYIAQNYLGPQGINEINAVFPYTRGQTRTILDRPDSGLEKDISDKLEPLPGGFGGE